MTEEQAKTKWCPFAKNHEGNGNVRHWTLTETRSGRCIASACMAWRTGPAGGFCGLAGDL